MKPSSIRAGSRWQDRRQPSRHIEVLRILQRPSGTACAVRYIESGQHRVINAEVLIRSYQAEE
jgi:hypothetical protein